MQVQGKGVHVTGVTLKIDTPPHLRIIRDRSEVKGDTESCIVIHMEAHLLVEA